MGATCLAGAEPRGAMRIAIVGLGLATALTAMTLVASAEEQTVERELKALYAMRGHLSTRDIAYAILSIGGVALLTLLVAAKLHWYPIPCRSPSAVRWRQASWCGGSGGAGSRSPGLSSLRWSASSWKTFRRSMSATSATVRKRKKK